VITVLCKKPAPLHAISMKVLATVSARIPGETLT